MRFARLVVAAVLVLVGLVWIGQGTGKIPGSAMSGVSFWAAAGVVLVVLSILILAWERWQMAKGRRCRSGSCGAPRPVPKRAVVPCADGRLRIPWTGNPSRPKPGRARSP